MQAVNKAAEAPSVPDARILHGHSLAFPKDLSYWLTEKEFPPKSKTPIAQEVVFLEDSQYSPQVLLIRAEEPASRRMSATYLAHDQLRG